MCAIRDSLGPEKNGYCHNDIQYHWIIKDMNEWMKKENEFVEVMWHRWILTLKN